MIAEQSYHHEAHQQRVDEEKDVPAREGHSLPVVECRHDVEYIGDGVQSDEREEELVVVSTHCVVHKWTEIHKELDT